MAPESDRVSAVWACAWHQVLSWDQQAGRLTHPELTFPITEGAMVPAMMTLMQCGEWQWRDEGLGQPGGASRPWSIGSETTSLMALGWGPRGRRAQGLQARGCNSNSEPTPNNSHLLTASQTSPHLTFRTTPPGRCSPRYMIEETGARKVSARTSERESKLP